MSGETKDMMAEQSVYGTRVLACAWLILVSLCFAGRAPAQVDCTADFYPGRVLVRFKAGATPADKQIAYTAAASTQVLKEFPSIPGLQVVTVPLGQEEAAVATYRLDANVDDASPDYIVQLACDPNELFYRSGRLWGLNNSSPTGLCFPATESCGQLGCQGCPDPGIADADINAREAWDIWQGPPGGKFPIAVIDNGVKYDHPDLYLNIWLNEGEISPIVRAQLVDMDGDSAITFLDLNHPANQGPGKIIDLNGNGYIDAGDILKLTAAGGWADSVDNDENGYPDDLIGWDFASMDRDPEDQTGHGTHISGIIAAHAHNGEGVAGVMWRAQLVPLKTTDGTTDSCAVVSEKIAAIQYCIDNNIKVMNLSWRLYRHCPLLYDIIRDARDAGILAVAAAGNERRNTDSQHAYPCDYGWSHQHQQSDGTYQIAALNNTICVAATDNDDHLAFFDDPAIGSNYGVQSVHLAAPGKNLWST